MYTKIKVLVLIGGYIAYDMADWSVIEGVLYIRQDQSYTFGEQTLARRVEIASYAAGQWVSVERVLP